MSAPVPVLFTLTQVADHIGIAVDGLRKRIQRGEIGSLPIFRIGDGPRSRWMCRKDDLEAWIQARKGGRK